MLPEKKRIFSNSHTHTTTRNERDRSDCVWATLSLSRLQWKCLNGWNIPTDLRLAEMFFISLTQTWHFPLQMYVRRRQERSKVLGKSFLVVYWIKVFFYWFQKKIICIIARMCTSMSVNLLFLCFHIIK